MKRAQYLYGVAGLIGLFLVYLFQREIQGFFAQPGWSTFTVFAAGRLLRFLLNDLFVILLIHALFPEKKFLYIAIIVQLMGTVGILLPYLALKYIYPAYNGPLISFLHRLVLNPLLLLLLIPAFYYQRQRESGRL